MFIGTKKKNFIHLRAVPLKTGFSIFYQLWTYYWFLKTCCYTCWDSFLKINITHKQMQALVFIRWWGCAMSTVYLLLMFLLQLAGLTYYLICTKVRYMPRFFFFFIQTTSNNIQPYKVCILVQFPFCIWFSKFKSGPEVICHCLSKFFRIHNAVEQVLQSLSIYSFTCSSSGVLGTCSILIL